MVNAGDPGGNAAFASYSEQQLVELQHAERKLARQIAQLRGDFDQRFAAPSAAIEDARVPLLLVRVGDQRHCLPLTGLVSFSAASRLTMLPGQHAACLGIAGHRGRAIPVYSLAVLLNAGATDNAPRWLAVTTDGIGIGITGFDGQIQVPAAAIRAREGRSGERFLHLDTVVHADRVCPVIDLSSVLSPFITRMRTAATVKE
jgi:chemotaxis signal transduction protein